jgi:hypothetical protein
VFIRLDLEGRQEPFHERIIFSGHFLYLYLHTL